MLKRPFDPLEYRKQTGIYIDLRRDAEERLTNEWKRYNEQQARINSGKFNKNEKHISKNFFKNSSIINLGLFICGTLLVFGILDLPYSYYKLLRAVICVVSFYTLLSNRTINPIRAFLIASIILFNPFEPFIFEKSTWVTIDLVFGVIYLAISLVDHFKIMTLTSNKE